MTIGNSTSVEHDLTGSRVMLLTEGTGQAILTQLKIIAFQLAEATGKEVTEEDVK